MPARQIFTKEEHLKSKKLIEQLFKEGSSITEQPIKLIYLPSEHRANIPVCIAITVSKKKFALAVDRNRIKRRMREAYRTNKGSLFAAINERNKYAFILVYQSDKELTYQEIELRIMALLKRFIDTHEVGS